MKAFDSSKKKELQEVLSTATSFVLRRGVPRTNTPIILYLSAYYLTTSIRFYPISLYLHTSFVIENIHIHIRIRISVLSSSMQIR